MDDNLFFLKMLAILSLPIFGPLMLIQWLLGLVGISIWAGKGIYF